MQAVIAPITTFASAVRRSGLTVRVARSALATARNDTSGRMAMCGYGHLGIRSRIATATFSSIASFSTRQASRFRRARTFITGTATRATTAWRTSRSNGRTIIRWITSASAAAWLRTSLAGIGSSLIDRVNDAASRFGRGRSEVASVRGNALTLADALTQARAAYRYFLDAGWSPWQCRP